MEIVEVPIGEINPAPYNPRVMSKAEEAQIRKSIEEFGMIQPMIVNSHPNRYNILIGGHQRLKILKKMQMETVPVVYIEIEDLRREQELNLRLNRNTGKFSVDLLGEMDAALLQEVGFTDQELKKILKDSEGGDDLQDPEVPFSEELEEEHNYVVLYFQHGIDWLRLCSLFPIPTVKSHASRPGYEQKGVGRVINGTEFLDFILEGRGGFSGREVSGVDNDG